MLRRVCLLFVAILIVSRESSAYGVLAHEAMIDAAWEHSIVPLLNARFHPTDEELQKARAFAYGGCVIQDLGYYPLSSRKFGDLTHYVRSGDFVVALINDASNVNEFAFALGALSHYEADNYGHPIAVNPSVALIYPKLRDKYGEQPTYEDNPAAHLKTEFAFDVVQIAGGEYVPTQYHRFIGFDVSRPVLERAFRDTYGLELGDVFGDFDTAVATFRYAVSTMIPQMTKVAWNTKRDEIEKLTPNVTRRQFLFGLARPEYEREWGTKYDHPGVRSKILSVVLRVIPKIGPFRSLAFKVPTPEAERLFVDSFAAGVLRYRQRLASIARGVPPLANLNLDIGKPVKPGEYRLADAAYEALLDELQKRGFQQTPPALRANLLAFFADFPPPVTSKKEWKHWQRLQAEITRLKASAAN